MATRTYRLKIVQEGREFEAEGDKAFVFDMLKRYGPQAPAAIGGTAESGRPPSKKHAEPVRPTEGKLTSIREFIQQLDLKKHTDITLAFGYYLEKRQGLAEFTPADINNCYYEAKLEASNTSQMIIQNIKRGYFMPSKKADDQGKNRYTLTSSGEKFVESKFQRAGA
jgi:hypothetical protein